MQSDKTQIMIEGTPEYPLDPVAALADEACPHCAAVIPAGAQFCERCGYQRGSWKQAAAAGAGAAPEAGKAGMAAVPPEQLAPYVLEAADGTQFPLRLGENSIGRSSADIVLADGFVSRRHARVTASAAGVTVADLGSSNGTFIEELKLEREAEEELAVGEFVRFGQTVLRLVALEDESRKPSAVAEEEIPPAEEPQAEQPAGSESQALEPANMELQPASSPWSLWRGDKLEFVLPFGASGIGRKPDVSDLVLRGDGFVSGLHARIVATDSTLEICDLGSTNGTYLNGERCEPSVILPVKAGDVIRMGQTDLTVVYEPLEEPQP